MTNLASWVSLLLWVYGLKADLIVRIHAPHPVYFNYSCTFPFLYEDELHHSCISVHSDYAWCSLDQIFQGRWRYCTALDPPRCTFPFLYRNKLFHRCTREGFVLSRSWCSLTWNYNRDGKWKQCSPYHV